MAELSVTSSRLGGVDGILLERSPVVIVPTFSIPTYGSLNGSEITNPESVLFDFGIDDDVDDADDTTSVS